MTHRSYVPVGSLELIVLTLWISAMTPDPSSSCPFENAGPWFSARISSGPARR
ncbi:1832_t:CDS:2, partial [Ambispora leptoticha]